VKQRLQVQGTLKEKQYNGVIDAFRKILRTEGFRGMLVGYFPSLLRDVPFAAIYFVSYESTKTLQIALKKKTFSQSQRAESGTATGIQTETETPRRQESLRTYNFLLSGAVAGAIAATLTIPFDVVKTKLQTQATLPPHDRRYTGVCQTFSTIWREEGAKGLRKGLSQKLMYLVPSASLTFAFYEQYKAFFTKFFSKSSSSSSSSSNNNNNNNNNNISSNSNSS